MNFKTSLLNSAMAPKLPNQEGEGGGGSDPNAWKTSLAGGDAARMQLLEGFDAPDKLFERLGRPPLDDWRKAMAGDDAEELKRLERFTDPAMFHKTYRNMEKSFSDAGRVKLPGEGASAEELAAWSKAIGLPEKPDGFEVKAKPPEGYEPSEADKSVLGRLTTKLHEAMSKGYRPADIVNLAHEFYYGEATQAAIDADNRAAEMALEAEADLKSMWGSKFDENARWAIAGVQQFFPGKGQEELDDFLGLTLSSGHKLGDHPMFLRMMASVGLQHAEDPFFLASKNQNQGFDPEKRKAEIMALRDTDPKRYNSPDIQAELDKIIAGLARRNATRAA